MTTNLHFQQDGTHYYYIGSIGERYHKADLYHRDLPLDTLVHNGHDTGWYVSDTPLATDGFYERHSDSKRIKIVLRDELPDHINRDALAPELPLDTEDFDWGFYQPVSKTFYFGSVIDGDWLHIDDAPCPDVVFSWSAKFPKYLATHQEMHHLIPCKVRFGRRNGDKTRNWLEAELKARFQKDTKTLYVFDDYYSIGFKNMPHIQGGYPILEADNLELLKAEFDKWFKKLCQKIERQIQYDKGGIIPESFVPPFDKEEFEARFSQATRITVTSAYKKQSSDVRKEMDSLRRYVWRMLLTAAAFESDLSLPTDLHDLDEAS